MKLLPERAQGASISVNLPQVLQLTRGTSMVPCFVWEKNINSAIRAVFGHLDPVAYVTCQACHLARITRHFKIDQTLGGVELDFRDDPQCLPLLSN